MKRKIHTVSNITVEEFYTKYKDKLSLELHNEDDPACYDLSRKITEPSTHQPGLALTGYLEYFAYLRVQLLGNSEMAYLRSLDPDTLHDRVQTLCEIGIPCIVVSRGAQVPEVVAETMKAFRIPVFQTTMETMRFSNRAARCLEREFAPTTSVHGCMLHFKGFGVLIKGKSGSGKSEAAIGLVERGAALIADDHVKLRNINGQITAYSKDIARGFIEMRGIGIVNVSNIYGLGAMMPDSKLDLIVNLVPESDLNNIDRTGIERETEDIMGAEIPYVDIPISPGRDTVRLITVTILELQLRQLGYDMANEFNQKLTEKMNPTQDATN